MDKALKELKIRAKKLLKAYQQDSLVLQPFDNILRKQKWSTRQELKLKDCQNLLAIKCGFKGWQEAQQTLTGKASTGKNLSQDNAVDFSGFLHSSSCDVLLNHWFANYQEAKQMLATNPDKVLLPYKRQFVVVGSEYLHLIGLSQTTNATPDIANLLGSIKRDLLKSYGSDEWDELAKQVVTAKLNK